MWAAPHEASDVELSLVIILLQPLYTPPPVALSSLCALSVNTAATLCADIYCQASSSN